MSSTSYRGRIACVGEAMAELMLGRDTSYPPALGFAGDTLNTAVYLKRLLKTSADVGFVSKVGADPLSARLLAFVESEGISTKAVGSSADRLLGLYAIATDHTGERTFSYWRNESAARTLFQDGQSVDFDALSGFDVLYLSAITLAILPDAVRNLLIRELGRLRSEHAVQVVFDSNYRPSLWESPEKAQRAVADAWRVTDIALPSIDDEMDLFNDADEQAVLTRLHSYGISRGALKRGPLGPLSLGEQHKDSVLRSENLCPDDLVIVDTTAAGDSFNAGYLAATLSGADESEAMLSGHNCSLRVISQAGAIIPRENW